MNKVQLNNFSVEIPQALNTNDESLFQLNHKQVYTIKLRNDNNKECDAKVKVDGKEVGTFRIQANSFVEIERPTNEKRCFTFYKSNSKEAKRSNISKVERKNLGLISVEFNLSDEQPVFTPVVPNIPYVNPLKPIWPRIPDYKPFWYSTGWDNPMVGSSEIKYQYSLNSYSSGGTGLSKESSQEFVYVPNIKYDLKMKTIIHLRLVCNQNNNEVVELKSVMETRFPKVI